MTVLNTSAVLNRRSLLLSATLAGTAGLLAACSGGNGSSAGSAQSSSNLLETIKSAGKIRIGVEGTYRPYTYHDASGKLAGFEYDIAETLAKDLGVTAEYFKEHPDANLRLLEGEVGPGTNVAVLLPKNQTALKDAIDASIKKHLGNGDFKAIFEKHVGEDLSPTS